MTSYSCHFSNLYDCYFKSSKAKELYCVRKTTNFKSVFPDNIPLQWAVHLRTAAISSHQFVSCTSISERIITIREPF